MPRSLAVELLVVRGFRNLLSVDVELGPRFNVVSGDNGQGKTNLLEAMYVLATSRSFRSTRMDELVAVGEEGAGVRGRIREDGEAREQSVVLRPGTRTAKVDDRRPPTLAAYALLTPAVVFHAGSMSLTTGGGSERRRLLDRLALYLLPASHEARESYAKAMRARQRVLEMRGGTSRDLDGWEELAARHGMAVCGARELATRELLPAVERAFVRIGPAGVDLSLAYRRGAPFTEAAFREELLQRRARDRVLRSAAVGPHRDDLELVLGGKPVRGMASQGQHRAVVLALKLAEIAVVAAARGVRPVLLLDDVSSELDRERTSALFAALQGEPSQVLLTTTRPSLIEIGDSEVEKRRDFRVVDGRVAPL